MKRLTILALLVCAAPASAGTIRKGTIVPGHGIAGATLGMTRAKVIDTLGQPVDEPNHIVMDYTDILNGDDGIFEVFRGQKSHKVNSFQLDSKGSGFKLSDGNAVFAHGGQKRLFDHYGSRLHQNPVYQGQKSYNLYGKFHGRKVGTTFLVSKFSHTSGKVYEIDIFYRR